MKRRKFISSLAIGSTALVITPKIVEAISPPTQVAELYLSSFPVRGLPFNDYDAVSDNLKTGTLLTLKREPQNSHDSYAISVCHGTHKIGYLPREHNHIPARLLDAGYALNARILRHDADAGYADEVLRAGLYLVKA
jgi:HIRAN domain